MNRANTLISQHQPWSCIDGACWRPTTETHHNLMIIVPTGRLPTHHRLWCRQRYRLPRRPSEGCYNSPLACNNDEQVNLVSSFVAFLNYLNIVGRKEWLRQWRNSKAFAVIVAQPVEGTSELSLLRCTGGRRYSKWKSHQSLTILKPDYLSIN